MELNKYEKARMLGSRALQISMGAPLLVKLSDKELEKIAYNPIEIAKLELAANKIPMEIRRETPRDKAKIEKSKEETEKKEAEKKEAEKKD